LRKLKQNPLTKAQSPQVFPEGTQKRDEEDMSSISH